jgi:hypothetical protein
LDPDPNPDPETEFHSGSAKAKSSGSGSTTLFLRRKILKITANIVYWLKTVIFYCIVKDFHATEKAFSPPEKKSSLVKHEFSTVHFYIFWRQFNPAPQHSSPHSVVYF